jgi:hypothetical protein
LNSASSASPAVFEDPAPVQLHQRFVDRPVAPEHLHRALFVDPHHVAVARDVGAQNGREPALERQRRSVWRGVVRHRVLALAGYNGVDSADGRRVQSLASGAHHCASAPPSMRIVGDSSTLRRRAPQPGGRSGDGKRHTVCARADRARSARARRRSRTRPVTSRSGPRPRTGRCR